MTEPVPTFTPGPWVAADDSFDSDVVKITTQSREAKSFIPIATVEVGWEGPIETEQRAGIGLILAAPCLFEALLEAKLQIQYLHDKFSQTGSGNAILARIDAALAKAQEPHQ
jgi:hypothetical protein